MYRSYSQRQSSAAGAEVEAVVYDDGGSGLLEACTSHFASTDVRIECDCRHTVWIKRSDGSRSVGLSPWLLNRYSLGEVLERAESRLDMSARVH